MYIFHQKAFDVNRGLSFHPLFCHPYLTKRTKFAIYYKIILK